MEKQKNFLKVTVTNKAEWIAFVVLTIGVIVATATACVISNNKNKTELASANVKNNIEENTEKHVVEQGSLIDTSKMSEEELKKLNEKEQKELEEKEKKKDKNTGTTTPKAKNKYYIKVNYGAQTVTVYTYDKNGKYTIPVKAFVCSTGTATPTSGVYNIGYKWVWGKLYGNVWGHYTTQIVGDILFHSVPYKQNRNDTLVSAYYDRLGNKDSMGCVRLTTIDAQWIFYNCPSGTQVEFYSSSNPGPLGKPSARKVSNAPGKLKNWDPTDPDSENPWIKYLKDQANKNQNTTNNNTVNNTTTNTTNITSTNNTTTNTTNNTATNTETNITNTTTNTGTNTTNTTANTENNTTTNTSTNVSTNTTNNTETNNTTNTTNSSNTTNTTNSNTTNNVVSENINSQISNPN